MKRLLIPLALLCLLGGCTPAQAQQESAAQRSSELEEGQSEQYGKIRSIHGNELVLVIGTLRQSKGAGEEVPAPAAGNEASAPSGSEPEAWAAQGGNAGREDGRAAAGDLSGTPPSAEGNAMPQMSGGRQAAVQAQAGGGLAGIALDYTGREITYLIPVTASITTGTGEDASSIRFTQLTEKNILRLVLDENGEIVSIQVLQ